MKITILIWMKEEKRTFNFLESMFEPESARENLVNFCSDYISQERMKNDKKLDCRHKCFYFGSIDGDKGPGIRKTTLVVSAQSSIQTPSTSTKIRCYHLAFFSKFVNDIPGLEAALLKIGEGHVIRHLCGCINCTDPNHLELGTVADSVNDRGIHLLLEAAWNTNPQIDYQILKLLLQHNKFDQF